MTSNHSFIQDANAGGLLQSDMMEDEAIFAASKINYYEELFFLFIHFNSSMG
jgi:hypothetical protein